MNRYNQISYKKYGKSFKELESIEKDEVIIEIDSELEHGDYSFN
jgi:hypothetical protein